MKISTKSMKMMVGLIGMVFLLAPLTVVAQDKVVVIPLFGNSKPLKNIVTVAKSNGMFTDPVAAVNSITDASASNPYLVVIGPGVYTITSTLYMKPYVDIAGSGENVTKLTGAISTEYSNASSAIISGADNCALTSLTVENTGGSKFSIALYSSSASTVIRHVTATASGGTYNYGVRNSGSSPTMNNVTATASGETYNRGVYNSTSSSPTMTNVTASASGGTDSCGVYNVSSSCPTMTNVTATASGGSSENYGVYNSSSSSPLIRRSTLEGEDYGLYSNSATATVSQSTIKNGASTYSTGTNTCVACDNGSGVALNSDCSEATP